MSERRYFKRIFSGCMAGLTILLITAPAYAAKEKAGLAASISQAAAVEPSAPDYFTYYAAHEHNAQPSETLSATFMKADRDAVMTDTAGEQGIVLDENVGWAEWSVLVDKTGLYSVQLEYYPLEATGMDIELSMQVDGSTPFSEADFISLPRLWRSQYATADGKPQKDQLGNEIKPPQQETPRWIDSWLVDAIGMYEDPYLVYLTEGTHVVRLTLNRERVAIKGLTMGSRAAPVSYKVYHAANATAGQPSGTLSRIEGELSLEQNSSLLAPTYDTANANMSPVSDPSRIVLNAVGGEGTWRNNGQSISWRVADDVKDGLYELVFRVKQDQNPGVVSYRALYINGEIPFAEARSIEFPYGSEWYIKTMGDAAPQLIRLKGGDVVTLEATTGKAGSILRSVNQVVLDLNELYRKIVTVTGVNPDTYRDYNIEQEIPGLLQGMEKQREVLLSLSSNIKELMGKPTSHTAILDQLVLMIKKFLAAPNTIPEDLGGFKSSINGVASIINSFSDQPLELDALYIKSTDVDAPRANQRFINRLKYDFRRFIHSFAADYSDLEKSGVDSVIRVWCMTGRDQAQIISRLVTEEFTPQTDVGVELNFTGNESILVQALMAGKGPDACLTLKTETPLNLALRGAAVNLNDKRFYFEKSYLDEFYESAFTSFRYKGGLYALPEMQSFDILFYRRDILESLELGVPKTWDEFYHAAKILHSNRLVLGVLETESETPGVSQSVNYFYYHLLQSGGSFYTEDNTKTAYDTAAAYDAFDKWVDLYRSYGFERSFDFASMMRTGEMPLGIAKYDTYFRVAATAPELSGLWGIAPLPGTTRPDGTVDNTGVSTTSGCSMLTPAFEGDREQETFAFLKWWTGGDTQAKYGRACEAVLGIAGRIYPANRVAFDKIGWTLGEKDILMGQWENTVGIPQVPGSYLVSRSLTGAMRKALEGLSESRRELTIYNNDLNGELARKAREFENND